jgi:hypothetical protein
MIARVIIKSIKGDWMIQDLTEDEKVIELMQRTTSDFWARKIWQERAGERR